MTKKGKKIPKTSFPLLERLARKLYDDLKAKFTRTVHKEFGLTENVSRAKEAIVASLCELRKHVDVSETNIFFHSYGNKGKVFMIGNNPTTAILRQRPLNASRFILNILLKWFAETLRTKDCHEALTLSGGRDLLSLLCSLR